MREEKYIRAGLEDAEKLAIERGNELTRAIKSKDWVRVHNCACEIMIASLAITAVTDACFDDRPEITYPTPKEFIESYFNLPKQ